MDSLFEWLHYASEGLSETQSKLVVTLIIIILLWIVKRLITKSVTRIQGDVSTRYRWRKNATYIVYMVGVVSIIFIWSNRFASFATFLGLVSAGLAIAFKDPITNMAGWYYIVAEKPFKVGDRVQIGDNIGDVIDISMFQTTMLEIGNWVKADQGTARIISVPNAHVFTMAIQNYTALMGHIWNEVRIPITFTSNWKKAKQLIQNILDERAPKLPPEVYEKLEELSGKYLISSAKLSHVVFCSIEENGIVLTMRYMCPVRQRRLSTEILHEAVLNTFAEHDDIHFAYNTLRIMKEL